MGITDRIIDNTIGKAWNERKNEQAAQSETQQDFKIQKDTLEPGESTIVNFRNSSDKDLRNNYPFQSIDVYNGSGEQIVVFINQRRHLVLPVPNGAQNGDSFPNNGITSVEIMNDGESSINTDDLNPTISGSPQGIERATR